MHNTLGIAIAELTLASYRSQLTSARWQRVFNVGGRAQRLLFASTGTKDPKASDTLYVNAFAEPFTVNTIPEKTLNAFADHGVITDNPHVDSYEVLARFAKAGIEATLWPLNFTPRVLLLS